MSAGGEDSVDGVAVCSEEKIAAEMAVGLHVADQRFDGVAAAQFAAGGRREAALLAADEDAVTRSNSIAATRS